MCLTKNGCKLKEQFINKYPHLIVLWNDNNVIKLFNDGAIDIENFNLAPSQVIGLNLIDMIFNRTCFLINLN